MALSSPPASIRRTSSSRDADASESRQPCSSGSVAGGRPSSVMPLSPSSRATLPVTRSTGATLDAELAEAVERRRVLDRDQPPQVLADDVVERDAVRRLVPLAAGKRRAIALGEERETEADDEERGRDDRVAGIAREREGREPQRRASGRATAARPAAAQVAADGRREPQRRR